jgi:MinD superfamily P-loop ATPase
MIVTVASGKGGTGKTTIATSLALAIERRPLTFLDCDVETPNAHLFLRPDWQERQEIGILIPQVDGERCNGCGVCAQVCQYHAIVVIGGKTLVFPELCHGCGSCTLNCPERAITEEMRSLGVLEGGLSQEKLSQERLFFSRGLLNVGEPMAVPVIRDLKNWRFSPAAEIVIRDAPPGTSCPVVESMRGSDFILLVTEPTPFGLHDLKLAAQVVDELEIPAGVVVNRDGIGNSEVDAYCQQVGLPILMRIPMQREIATALADGQPLAAAFPEYIPRFRKLYADIRSLAQENLK